MAVLWKRAPLSSLGMEKVLYDIIHPWLNIDNSSNPFQATTCCNGHLMSRKQHFMSLLHIVQLLYFFSTLFHYVFSVLEGMIQMSRTALSITTYSLHLGKPWVSILHHLLLPREVSLIKAEGGPCLELQMWILRRYSEIMFHLAKKQQQVSS